MNLLRRGRSTRTLGCRRAFSTHQQKQEEERGAQARAEEGNITRQNFWKSLDSFKAHLSTAHFIGFDLELSGIYSRPPVECLRAAPPSPLRRSYQRLKHLAEKFTVFQVLDEHFKDLVFVARSDCVSGVRHDVEIFFAKSKEHADSIKSELERGCEQAKINEAIGFGHIVDAIVTSRKPLVGHNCALDLAHIHDKFLSPLPSSAEEFSASLLTHFPTIIDTKYLMKVVPILQSTWRRKHTSLNAIYSYLCKSNDTRVGTARFAGPTNELSLKPHIEIIAGFKRYQNRDENLLHEAGYDAFMTGCVFAQICHRLNVNVKDLLPTVRNTQIASRIEEFINLLNFGQGILDLRTGKLREPVKDLDQIPAMKAIGCAEEINGPDVSHHLHPC